MKARLCQLRKELKSINKLNHLAFEFVLRIKSIIDSLFSISDLIIEHGQIDVVLDGILEKHIPFVMQVYDRSKPPMMYDVYALLYVQEPELDKFIQELFVSNVYIY